MTNGQKYEDWLKNKEGRGGYLTDPRRLTWTSSRARAAVRLGRTAALRNGSQKFRFLGFLGNSSAEHPLPPGPIGPGLCLFSDASRKIQKLFLVTLAVTLLVTIRRRSLATMGLRS
jgi:hypothetical protein